MVVKKDTFVLNFFYKSISGDFYLFGCNPNLLLCRCNIVVLIDFSVCLFIKPSARLGQFLRKSSLIS